MWTPPAATIVPVAGIPHAAVMMAVLSRVPLPAAGIVSVAFVGVCPLPVRFGAAIFISISRILAGVYNLDSNNISIYIVILQQVHHINYNIHIHQTT